MTSSSVHAEILPWTMSTNFGGDSSSRFPFAAQTDATERPSPRRGYKAGVGNNIQHDKTDNATYAAQTYGYFVPDR